MDLKKPGRKLSVAEWSTQKVRKEMVNEGVKTPRDLETYNLRVFDSKAKADSFLRKYKKILNRLSNRRICKSRELPAMLYKRRFMVLSLMGLKGQTYRDYGKDWKRGQLFNLHDQVFFLTVKLKSITYDSSDKLHCYKFEVVGQR